MKIKYIDLKGWDIIIYILKKIEKYKTKSILYVESISKIFSSFVQNNWSILA